MSWLKKSVMDIYYNRQCTYVSGCVHKIPEESCSEGFFWENLFS